MIPSPLRDHLFVQVDTASLDRTPSGLYIPDWQPGDKDAVQAVVVAVPLSLSDRKLGFPNMDGRAYIYRDLRDLPRVGETVFLKPNTFKPHQEYPGHPGVFLVELDKVIAVKLRLEKTLTPQQVEDDGMQIRAFQGLLLCEPVYGDDVRMGDKGVRERVEYRSQTGVCDEANMRDYTTTLLIKEVDPLPLPFTLRITHDGVPLHQQPNLVQVGDVVLAHKMCFAWHAVKQKDNEEASARWCWQPSSIVIAGKEYAYIPRQCVMAKPE